MPDPAQTHGNLVSIIVPTYNSEEKIENCLKSIIGQSYPEKELVIIDGNSRDSTLKIVIRYAEAHPFIRFVSEPDRGIYDAMNKGIQMARGKWLLFLGSDDALYNPRVLSDFIRSARDSRARLVYGNVQLEGDSLMGKDGSLYDGAFSVKKLFEKNISHQAIFYDRSVFNELGSFNISYSTCADWDFNHRCFAKFNTLYIDLVISKFVTGGLSTLQGADLYTENECIFRLREYYGISFSNKLFKSYSWVFAFHAGREFKRKNYRKSVYYFFFYLKHSDNKVVILKILLKDIFTGIRGKARRIDNKNPTLL